MPKAKLDHNLAPLRIDARTWWKLEKRLGVSLGKWAREEIIAAADEFAIRQHFFCIDNTRRKLGGRDGGISKLRASFKRVLSNWREIQSDSIAKRLFEDVSDDLRFGDIAHTMEILQYVDHRLGPYLSPPKHSPFNRYVKKISGVCENKKVLGKTPGITIPSGVDQKTSPFVEFMMTLNTALPDYAQQEHSTPAAWALALYRARK